MSYDDNGAPIRRRTHLTGETEELRYLALELETEHDAYVSRGRAPWRGLSGHDPLDDVPDEEFGERQWEDWHDGMYDEEDPERPRRRRPSGREVDIVPPAVGERLIEHVTFGTVDAAAEQLAQRLDQ